MHLIAVSDTRVCKSEEKEHSNICFPIKNQRLDEVRVIVSCTGTINMYYLLTYYGYRRHNYVSVYFNCNSVLLMFIDYGDSSNRLDENGYIS